MVRMTIGSKARGAREPRRVHVAALAQVTSVAVTQRCAYCAEDLVRVVVSEAVRLDEVDAWAKAATDLFDEGTMVVVVDGEAHELRRRIGDRDVVCTPLPPGGGS